MLVSVLPFVLLLTNFLPFSLQAKPYNFTPESRHIEVNDGDFYEISFEEINNETTIFTYCYIVSDTFSASYPVNKTEAEEEEDEKFVQRKTLYSDTLTGCSIYNETNSKICGLLCWTANDKVPLKWTIIAFDNLTRRNFTEEVTVAFYYNMPLYLENLPVLPTASAFNFFRANDTKLKTCSIGFDNKTVDLDLNAIKINNEDNVFKSRLTSLGGGRCGYKINNLSRGDPKELILYTTDAQKKVYRSIATLAVVQTDYLKNRTMEVDLGDMVIVICGTTVTDLPVSDNEKFCYLYNPQGDLVSYDQLCAYQLDIVTLGDLGTWRCSIGFDYILDVLEFTTEVVEKKSGSVEIFTEETPELLTIGCQVAHFSNNELKYCKFTRPDGKMFKVSKGAANVYYSAITTDLEKGRCSLEILKPLRNEDKGSWKCEPVLFTEGSVGAFITVEKATIPPPNDCLVPYASDYCHIVAPNGTQYEPDHLLQITSGLCFFTVEDATPSDNGTWSCSVAQKNGIPDEIITIEISVIELKVLYTDVETSEGEEVELICNTNGIPIEYCRFVSSSGQSFTLRKEHSTSSNKISYKGRGLEYGDCGIKISKVSQADGGRWNCHIRAGRAYNWEHKTDLTKTIELTIHPPRSATSLAESVGIAVGVLTVAIATGGFVFYKYSKRRRHVQESVEFAARESNQSDSSGESVILSVLQTNYNN